MVDAGLSVPIRDRLVLVAFLALDCVSPPAPAPAPATGLARDWARGPWTKVTLKRFGLSLELPDADGWQLVRRRSRFVELTHPASGSTLIVRGWFEHEPMTAERCEAAARLLRDFPAGDAVIDQRRTPIAGFDALQTVRIAPGRGSLTAFGANAQRCLAVCFESRGDDRRAIERRLIAMQERALSGLRVDSGIAIDPREPRATAPGEKRE